MSTWNDHCLLSTKLTIPRLYVKTLLPRPRLYGTLEQGVHYPLTFISAPAGFGKTALMSEWLRQQGTAVAWVSLEQNDNDIERFWRYVAAALEKAYPDVAASAAITLSGKQAVMLEEMLNALALCEHDLLLVLDDYHVIAASEIHHSLEFFLEHLPPHVHLVLMTRIDPPLALGRLRVQGKVVELRASDLRFLPQETAELLQQGLGLSLTVEQLAALDTLTEGWIAAIQLVARSLQDQRDEEAISHTLQTPVGTNRHILSYLNEEVVLSLPEEVQRFLLTTSILTRVNADLCDAVTEQHNSATLLEWLEQASLFLTALPGHGNWYRYHPLFVSALRHRLHLECTEVAVLHLRASVWYEQHGLWHEAVEHALAIPDSTRAAQLIERYAGALIEQGLILHMYTWLERLQRYAPLATSPWLSYVLAEKFLQQGQWEQYEHALRRAEQLCPVEDISLAMHLQSLRAYGALLSGDGEAAISSVQQALTIAGETDQLPAIALVWLGAGYLYSGDLVQAHATLLHVRHVAWRKEQPVAQCSAALYLGDLYRCQGRLDEAEELYRRGVREMEDTILWQGIALHCRLGALAYEWDDPHNVEAHLRRAISLRRQLYRHIYGDLATTHSSYEEDILSARLAWMRGEYKQAMDLLSEADVAAQRSGRERNRTRLATIMALRVQYALARDEREAAIHWLMHYKPATEEQMSPLERELWYQARARLLIVQDKAEEAITLLEATLQTACLQGRIDSQVQLHILLTRAYYNANDIRHAKQALEQALLLAEPSGYRRMFLDEGDELAILLSELYRRFQKKPAIEQNMHMLEYVHMLLKGLGMEKDLPDWWGTESGLRRMPSPLDQLSEREQDVLRLIAEGHSNQQIARALVVAESTIKTHLNNIYTKLNVNSRLQALTKAHASGLL